MNETIPMEKRAEYGKEKTLEEMAKKVLDNMDAMDVRRLLSAGRSTWTRGQTKTMKTDKILKDEVKVINGDLELTLLLVQKQILEGKIDDRMRTLINESRPVPFQMSSQGVRIVLEDYDFNLLNKHCEQARLDLIPVHHLGTAYIKPTSIAKTAENSLDEILEVLKGSVSANAA